MEFERSTLSVWTEVLSSYSSRIQSVNKPNLVSLDDGYRNELPPLLRQQNPSPFITTTRGKWRPRLLDFVSVLDEDVVKSASQKAFQALADISKAISQLTVLKAVGPATASAVLAAYAPDVAPVMSDEAWLQLLATAKTIHYAVPVIRK